jgi:hypothetical protein
MAALWDWLEEQDQPGRQGGLTPTPAGDQPPSLPIVEPPTDRKAPRIAALGSRRKPVHVVEIFVPETRFSSPFGARGGTRMFSQAEVATEYDVEINQPGPTAGYNFDTYISTSPQTSGSRPNISMAPDTGCSWARLNARAVTSGGAWR